MSIDRVERLRLAALDHDVPNMRSDEGSLLWYRGWMDSSQDGNIVRRQKRRRIC